MTSAVLSSSRCVSQIRLSTCADRDESAPSLRLATFSESACRWKSAAQLRLSSCQPAGLTLRRSVQCALSARGAPSASKSDGVVSNASSRRTSVIAAAASSGGMVEPTGGDSPLRTSPSGNGNGNGGARALQLAAAAAAVVVAVAVGFTASAGGPASVLSALAKSGFTAAFSLIFVSEIGDKTFFIAALLAMRHSKLLVLTGAVSALGVMSAISALIGRLFREVPAQLHTTIPVGEYLACALLVWFGVRSIQSALQLPATPAAATAGAKSSSDDEEGELAEAREFVDKAEAEKPVATPFEVFWEAFTLIFVAEWGDRSMLATIALGAAQSPVGVALGATMGHLLATGLAVMGGALLSKHISERLVGIVGGVLFLVFAAATILGVF